MEIWGNRTRRQYGGETQDIVLRSNRIPGGVRELWRQTIRNQLAAGEKPCRFGIRVYKERKLVEIRIFPGREEREAAWRPVLRDHCGECVMERDFLFG